MRGRTTEGGVVFEGAGGRAGLKRSGYQGGMQCPLIARWPGHIAPSSESSLLSAHYDFMATLADIAGTSCPPGKDSISYLPTLLGKPQKKTHDYLVINNGFDRMGKTALITREGWKLVETGRTENQFQLYNIKTDNEERHNLEEKFPEKTEQLKAILLRELDSPRPDLATR
jgi:arylsulfatase A-like enzyme